MTTTQLIFSPTGKTQYVADIIAAKWGNPIRKFDLTSANTDYTSLKLTKEELVLLAVPSYGGRVPFLAAQRIAKIQGNGAKCVLVCVYGNRAYEDTLIELNDIAEKCGFQVIAAVAAVAQHSIMPQYAAGRPDSQDLQELHAFSEKILEKLNACTSASTASLSLPGKRPYKELRVVRLIPKANEACTACGICAEQCPAQAIEKGDFRTTNSNQCISCMRCVKQCPQAAREVDPAMISSLAAAIEKACSVRKNNELYL